MSISDYTRRGVLAGPAHGVIQRLGRLKKDGDDAPICEDGGRWYRATVDEKGRLVKARSRSRAGPSSRTGSTSKDAVSISCPTSSTEGGRGRRELE